MSRFIPPALPVLKNTAPAGPQWVHEVKFDGWRVQLHKSGERAIVFSRNGNGSVAAFRWSRTLC